MSVIIRSSAALTDLYALSMLYMLIYMLTDRPWIALESRSRYVNNER